jgi:hypothetical protein
VNYSLTFYVLLYENLFLDDKKPQTIPSLYNQLNHEHGGRTGTANKQQGGSQGHLGAAH